MSTVFNVDTLGNLLTIGTVRHSILNSAGVVHTNSSGVLSTSLIVGSDITSFTITGGKIASNTITNSNLSNMPAHTFKGNNSASSDEPLDLTVSEMQSELEIPVPIIQTVTFQMTGSVTPTFDFPVTFAKCGKIVTMQWDGFQKATTNTTDFLFTGDVVPSEFLPSFPSGNPLVWTKTVIDGESPTDLSEGSLSFGPLGNIQIGTGSLGFPFTHAECGILGSSISYIVD